MQNERISQRGGGDAGPRRPSKLAGPRGPVAAAGGGYGGPGRSRSAAGLARTARRPSRPSPTVAGAPIFKSMNTIIAASPALAAAGSRGGAGRGTVCEVAP